MVKQLIEVGRGCAFFYDGEGTETVYPCVRPSDYLAERAKRREKRHEDRRWRHERHGQVPRLEIHTV